MAEPEKKQLTTEELVNIANGLQAQVKQLNAMVQDLGSKVAAKEVQNSQLKAIIDSLTAAQQAQADDVSEEE